MSSQDSCVDPKDALIALLSDKTIAYRPTFAHLYGVKTAVFLSQLLYWHGKGWYGKWQYKTQKQWYDETGLTRRELEYCRKSLLKVGVLEEKLAGVPATMHYKLDIDALARQVYEYQQIADCTKRTNSDCTKRANRNGANVQTITESTTEITHENTLAERPKTPPQLLWDALVEALQCEPQTDTARGPWNRGIKELLKAGVTPPEIPEIVANYHKKFNGKGSKIDCTPMALSKWLHTIRPAPRPNEPVETVIIGDGLDAIVAARNLCPYCGYCIDHDAGLHASALEHWVIVFEQNYPNIYPAVTMREFWDIQRNYDGRPMQWLKAIAERGQVLCEGG